MNVAGVHKVRWLSEGERVFDGSRGGSLTRSSAVEIMELCVFAHT